MKKAVNLNINNESPLWIAEINSKHLLCNAFGVQQVLNRNKKIIDTSTLIFYGKINMEKINPARDAYDPNYAKSIKDNIASFEKAKELQIYNNGIAGSTMLEKLLAKNAKPDFNMRRKDGSNISLKRVGTRSIEQIEYPKTKTKLYQYVYTDKSEQTGYKKGIILLPFDITEIERYYKMKRDKLYDKYGSSYEKAKPEFEELKAKYIQVMVEVANEHLALKEITRKEKELCGFMGYFNLDFMKDREEGTADFLNKYFSERAKAEINKNTKVKNRAH